MSDAGEQGGGREGRREVKGLSSSEGSRPPPSSSSTRRSTLGSEDEIGLESCKGEEFGGKSFKEGDVVGMANGTEVSSSKNI